MVGKKNTKSCTDNYSHRCICLQQMAKIKGNQNKYTLRSDCCGLLIPPLHYCLSHTEPTMNSNLENPPRQPPSLLSTGWGQCPGRKGMGWDGMRWAGKITRSSNRFTLVLVNSFVWLRNAFVRSRKRIQTKQKSRRPSLITVGAQHVVAPAEHGLNLAFQHLLSQHPQ